MNFYKECINEEVYGGRKIGFIKKVKIRTFNPNLNAVYLLRRFQYYAHKKGRINHYISKVYQKKLNEKFGIYLRKTTVIGKGLKLPHPTSIVFGEWTVIGDNNWIYQNVTFGNRNRYSIEKKEQPKTMNNCIFYAGSCMIGNIVVNENTIVGANAIISCNTEENSIYVAYNKKVK